MVVAAGALLAAGGFVATRHQKDTLDRAVATSCAQAATFKRTQQPPPGLPPRYDIFGDFATVATIQIKALEHVTPPPERAALHSRLLAGERQLLALTQQGEAIIGPYTQRGDFAGVARSGAMAEAMPLVQSLISQSKTLDGVFEENFGIKHRAD